MNFLKALLNLFLGSGPIAIPENAVLVDVRSPEELLSSSIAGAVNIPLADITVLSNVLLPEKNRPIVVFCASACALQQHAQNFFPLVMKMSQMVGASAP